MFQAAYIAVLAVASWPALPPLPDPGPAPATGPDFVMVQASDPIEHEACHGLHATLRQRFGQGVVYVGEGKAAVIVQPKMRLSDVARAVPAAKRGPVYQLYMVNASQWWENEPLYVLDEQGCYLNGTLWYRAHGNAQQVAYSAARSAELAEYADVLLALAKQLPGYDATQLAAVLDYQRTRLKDMQAIQPAPQPSTCPNGKCPLGRH